MTNVSDLPDAILAKKMSRLLDQRIAFRLPVILGGAMLAGGRSTAAITLVRCGGGQGLGPL